MGVYSSDTDFDTGIQDVVNAILVNPKFIFVSTTGPQSQVDGATFAIDDYAIASRLSYALWQTMPDATLTVQEIQWYPIWDAPIAIPIVPTLDVVVPVVANNPESVSPLTSPALPYVSVGLAAP